MTTICYYSNFCEPCKKLLQLIARTQLQNKIHFICIDIRLKDARGQTFVQVDKEQVPLPLLITKVPALYLMESGQVLFEDDIYKFLAPQEAKITHEVTNGHLEPECYSSQMMSAMSDSFSFWDQEAGELVATGNGGARQMHNFVSFDESYSIETPAESYEPDKIGKNGTKTLEEYKAEREAAVAAPIMRT